MENEKNFSEKLKKSIKRDVELLDQLVTDKVVFLRQTKQFQIINRIEIYLKLINELNNQSQSFVGEDLKKMVTDTIDKDKGDLFAVIKTLKEKPTERLSTLNSMQAKR